VGLRGDLDLTGLSRREDDARHHSGGARYDVDGSRRPGVASGGPVRLPPPTCFIPVLRSGFYADQGCRTSMEDAHVALDSLSHVATGRTLCQPQGFYGVSNALCPKALRLTEGCPTILGLERGRVPCLA